MEETEEIVSEGAHPEEPKPKPVPFVIYLENERIVLGSAVLRENGMMDVEMNAPVDSRAEHILSVVEGEFKFGLPRRIKPYVPPTWEWEHQSIPVEPAIDLHEYLSGNTISDGSVPE